MNAATIVGTFAAIAALTAPSPTTASDDDAETRGASATTEVLVVSDEARQALHVLIDGREALAYQYGDEWATPHIWPLRSPSGRLLTVQRTEPYPHHRSIWIADRVQMGDLPEVDFYHSWKNHKKEGEPDSGYRHFIEHVGFTKQAVEDGAVLIGVDARWIVNETQPVLDDHRDMTVQPLGEGEYLVDLAFTLTASYGDVTFKSDWVHYAWPYIRMHPQFSGESGGVITDSEGRTGQAGTNEKYAQWMDYSNTIDGVAEGLAVFFHPDGGRPKWLTREYGTFGPRRADEQSGTGFVLKQGEALRGRVSILVHKGDVESGNVAQRYEDYVGRGGDVNDECLMTSEDVQSDVAATPSVRQ